VSPRGGIAISRSATESNTLTAVLWGYNPVCKVTPGILCGVVSQECKLTRVILHGVVSQECKVTLVILHGVVSQEVPWVRSTCMGE
jgi:hypothetical protein